MIRIPEHKNFHQNADKCRGSVQPCAVCGKPCPTPKYYIHVGNGGGWAVTEEEAAADPAGDLGGYPVGADCWNKYPQLHPYGSKV
jgi:hypothetical protein